MPAVDIRINAPNIFKIKPHKGLLLGRLFLGNQYALRAVIEPGGIQIADRIPICTTSFAVNSVYTGRTVLRSQRSQIIAVLTCGIAIIEKSGQNIVVIAYRCTEIRMQITLIVAIQNHRFCGKRQTAANHIIMCGIYIDIAVITALQHGGIHERANQTARHGKIVLFVFCYTDFASVAAIANIGIFIAGTCNAASCALSTGAGCKYITAITAVFHDIAAGISVTSTVISSNTTGLCVAAGAGCFNIATVFTIGYFALTVAGNTAAISILRGAVLHLMAAISIDMARVFCAYQCSQAISYNTTTECVSGIDRLDFTFVKTIRHRFIAISCDTAGVGIGIRTLDLC